MAFDVTLTPATRLPATLLPLTLIHVGPRKWMPTAPWNPASAYRIATGSTNSQRLLAPSPRQTSKPRPRRPQRAPPPAPTATPPHPRRPPRAPPPPPP